MGRRYRCRFGTRCLGFRLSRVSRPNLKPGSAPHMGYTAAGYADGGSYNFHFPDGNASIARLLVRNLIPSSLPGASAKDVVEARVDYSRLDHPASPVRIRLGSTVARARNVGDPSSPTEVESRISRRRGASVRAGSCVLACFNMMIPYLCPELPEKQKEALKYPVKTPVIYSSVALTNWMSFKSSEVLLEFIHPAHIFHRFS